MEAFSQKLPFFYGLNQKTKPPFNTLRKLYER